MQVSPLPGSGRLLESSRWAASRRGARPPVSATARGAVVHQSSENAGAQDVPGTTVWPDGRRSLVLVSDDNVSDSQKTQVLLFALDR